MMPVVVVICIGIVIAASIYMILAVLTATGYCERHQRLYYTEQCPECERERRDAKCLRNHLR